jgi:hypothetical protein
LFYFFPDATPENFEIYYVSIINEDWCVAPVVEGLPNKLKALSSTKNILYII